MLDNKANKNRIAVSANVREAAINAPRDPDTTMQLSSAVAVTIDRNRSTDVDEMNGLEEASRIYDNGVTGASFEMPFDKAQVQHILFLLAYCLGKSSVVPSGSGYLHTITPIAGNLDARRPNPSFTVTMQAGETIYKCRYASGMVDSVTLTAARGEFVKISGSVKLTGKREYDYVSETVSALDNVTELTLAANGVAGADAESRMDNIHEVRAEVSPGVWEQVTVTDVSDATPAVLTIEPAGGTGTETISYKILYRIAAAASWATFPAQITESPLKVSQTKVVIGGKWNGTTFEGGRTAACELKSIEWTPQNSITMDSCFNESDQYAGRADRDGRKQTVKVDREFRNMVWEQMLEDNETFGLSVLMTGAEYETGHNYHVEIIFPKLGFNSRSTSVDGKKLAESAELQVLEDATYGSVIVTGENLVPKYAAAV